MKLNEADEADGTGAGQPLKRSGPVLFSVMPTTIAGYALQTLSFMPHSLHAVFTGVLKDK